LVQVAPPSVERTTLAAWVPNASSTPAQIVEGLPGSTAIAVVS